MGSQSEATLPASESDTTGYVVLITCPPGVEPTCFEARASIEACLSAMGVLPAPRSSVTGMAEQKDWSRTSCFCYGDQESCDEIMEYSDDGPKIVAATKVLVEQTEHHFVRPHVFHPHPLLLHYTFLTAAASKDLLALFNVPLAGDELW
jgi:hypothetical protein